MENVTKNEMLLVLRIFKNPKVEYNANSIAKQIGISSMGALKIARKLEKQGVLNSKKLGKSKFYNLNLKKDYVNQYIKFLLKREVEQSIPYIKVWVNEIKKIKSAKCGVLFGSVLKKHKEAEDIDVLLVTNETKFPALKQEIEKINSINTKKLHPLFQTKEDLLKNVKKEDKVVLSALNGLVIFGEEEIIKVLEK